MLTRTCSKVEFLLHQLGPFQVPSRDKHTFPSLYRFGLNLTCPFPVVHKLTINYKDYNDIIKVYNKNDENLLVVVMDMLKVKVYQTQTFHARKECLEVR